MSTRKILPKILLRIFGLFALGWACYYTAGMDFALLYIAYTVTYFSIIMYRNPYAVKSFIMKDEEEWLVGIAKVIYYLPLLLASIALYIYTDDELMDCFNFDPTIYHAITYVIFILLVFIARRAYLNAAPKFDGTTMDLLLQAQSEEDLSVYATLKCFDELADAEKLKAILDEHNIPSMIYGASKPDYISRENLPIQVMVRKLDMDAAKRLLEQSS